LVSNIQVCTEPIKRQAAWGKNGSTACLILLFISRPKISDLLEDCSTTSQQRLANADAKTDAAAKPTGRRRNKGNTFFF
jgi:hypothetical protein